MEKMEREAFWEENSLVENEKINSETQTDRPFLSNDDRTRMYQCMLILGSFPFIGAALYANVICNAIRKDLFKVLTIYFVQPDNSYKFFSCDSMAANIDSHSGTKGTLKP